MVLSDSHFVQLNDLVVVVGYVDTLRANGLDSLDALFHVKRGESLHKPGLDGWRERLRLTLDVGGGPRTFYLKRFTNPPLKARREVRRSGSGASSTAGVEWTWMRRLAENGIRCVTPVALGERLRRGREVRSALLTEAVAGESLERWAARMGGEGRSECRAECRRLIEPLAALVARLHERGYVHRDLYLSHIFHDPAAPPESSLCLIDLQRVLRPGHCRERWIVKDLAALDYSTPADVVGRTERVRWLTAYLGIRKLDARARRLVYRIAGKTRRIDRHDRRRQARWRMEDGGS